MSGQEPAGPVLVGMGRFDGRGKLIGLESVRGSRVNGPSRQSIEIIQPLYTLPDYLAPSAPSLAVRLRWFLAGAVSAALVCLAALALGGAV